MKTFTDSASAKIILLGEHAVVYDEPAIAAPLCGLRTSATLRLTSDPSCYLLKSEDFQLVYHSKQADCPPVLYPLVTLIELIGQNYGVPMGGWELTVGSKVPIARGLGSGAAASGAVIRVMDQAFLLNLPLDRKSALAYEIEKIHHGKPSGIDNTVITYERPILFRRRQPIELLQTREFCFVVADTGIIQSTREVVEDVARRRAQNSEYFDGLFTEIGKLTLLGKQAMASGNVQGFGALLTANHRLLQELGVSHPILDRLVNAALQAGAAGAKLCGSGRGGCMVSLAPDAAAMAGIAESLQAHGAVFVFQTRLPETATTDESCSLT